MLKLKFAFTSLVLCCLFISVSAQAETGCSIVYGPDWAFLFKTPDKWESACPVNNQSGMVITLWPEGFQWAQAPGIIYATVSDKDNFTLEQFAEDELARFRTESPELQVKAVESLTLQDKRVALVKELSGDQYGNHEIIAYADAGNAYLIFVLSSKTQEEYERLKLSFKELVRSVSPMKIKFEGAKKSP